MNGAVDQADGLRRLLTAGRPRIISIAGMSRQVGATTAAMNLCVELSRQGKPVLLLDEHGPSRQSACSVWSVAPGGSLADVTSGRMDLASAAAHVSCGVKILPAPRTALSCVNPRSLWPQGVIVIDVCLDESRQLSSLARTADDVVIVMQPSAASITSAYAALKGLQYTHALQTFQFIVNQAGDARQAQVVISNVVNTSSRFLAVSLRPLGWVSCDCLVREAARLRKTVCEADPTRTAAREFRQIAAALTRAAVSSSRPLLAAPADSGPPALAPAPRAA